MVFEPFGIPAQSKQLKSPVQFPHAFSKQTGVGVAAGGHTEPPFGIPKQSTQVEFHFGSLGSLQIPQASNTQELGV
jgi:hypothetical protein